MVVAAVAAGVWFGASSSTPAAPVGLPGTGLDTAGAVEPILTVHVAGAVARPGLVQVPEGARVADAVAAAGGATEEARLAAVNLAEPVYDGQRVTVPGPERAPPGTDAAGDGLVAINTAAIDELQRLPGVGPVLAERIVRHRESSGPFEQVEDLLDVPGIGENKLASLRDLVRVP